MLLRQWHSYLGGLIGPSVIFFALTGALQLFGLHEAHGNYMPVPFVEELASVHKDQVLAVPSQRTIPTSAKQHLRPVHDREPKASRFILKCFFAIVAVGLATTTSLGIWIGLTRPRGRTPMLWLLAAGITIPIILLLL